VAPAMESPPVATESGMSTAMPARIYGWSIHDWRWIGASWPHEQADRWRPRWRRGAPGTEAADEWARKVQRDVEKMMSCTADDEEVRRRGTRWRLGA
jgi:hypothetical protein